MQQEGLSEMRAVREEGRWADGRRRRVEGRGKGPCDKGRLTHGTNYPRQCGGGAPENERTPGSFWNRRGLRAAEANGVDDRAGLSEMVGL